MVSRIRHIAVVILCTLMAGCGGSSSVEPEALVSDQELSDLITLDGQRRLQNFVLPESNDFASIPQDARNPLSAPKVELGKLLFHEPALSANSLHPSAVGTFSCSTCHHSGAGFRAGAQRSIGDGGSGWGQNGEGRRFAANYPGVDVDAPGLKSPTVLNSAFQKVMLWSGGAGANGPNAGTDAAWGNIGGSAANHHGYDGLESQAIVALTVHRMFKPVATQQLIDDNPAYRALWDAVFPGEPVSDEKIGLAIAAYERTVLANRAPFQRWLKGETGAMTEPQKRGALVYFSDDAACSDCHTGPALASMAFYALGMPDMPGESSLGRGEFLGEEESVFKFKVPSLYNLADSPFLGHGGTFSSVAEVVDYYVTGVPEQSLPAGRVTDQFHPLTLTTGQVADLIEFVRGALRDPELDRYVPSSVPSGGCIPANDTQARADLGCQ